MRVEIEGGSSGYGAFTDGFVVGCKPDYTDKPYISTRWVHVYKDVPPSAIVVKFGYWHGSLQWKSVEIADGRPVSDEDIREAECCLKARTITGHNKKVQNDVPY